MVLSRALDPRVALAAASPAPARSAARSSRCRNSPTRPEGSSLLRSLEAIDPQPVAVTFEPLDQRTGHDVARFVAAVPIAPVARVGELHLIRVTAPMVSDDLPVSASHRRHPAPGIPLALSDMTALPMCGL